jgi:hypothetical protein
VRFGAVTATVWRRDTERIVCGTVGISEGRGG